MDSCGTAIDLNDEEQPCVNCGGCTDTGFECTECGFDNIDWYYPERKSGDKA